MAFKDLGDWTDLAGLALPIRGKVYTVPPVDAETGPRVQALIDLARTRSGVGELTDDEIELLSDTDEIALYRRVLGPAYDQMQADLVPWASIKHAAMTSMIDAAAGRERAERFWESLGKQTPAKKPARTPTKKPADRKTPARKATAKRTSTASSAGTTSRPRRSATPAPRGRRSSSTGG